MKPHNPIEHVVIIVIENHTFDNYFGTFPRANGVSLPHAADDMSDYFDFAQAPLSPPVLSGTSSQAKH